jgi:hypothetical protein
MYNVTLAGDTTKPPEKKNTPSGGSGFDPELLEKVGTSLPGILEALFGKKQQTGLNPFASKEDEKKSSVIWWVVLGIGSAVLIGGTVLALRRPAPRNVS